MRFPSRTSIPLRIAGACGRTASGGRASIAVANRRDRITGKRMRHLHSDPDIVDRGSFAPLVPGVEHASRFDQQQLDLGFRKRLVLDALRDDKHLAGSDVNTAVAEVDSQPPLDDNESLVSVPVIVPEEIALQFDDLEL